MKVGTTGHKRALVSFSVALVPCTCSPLLRDMHRQTVVFEALDARHAKTIVDEMFPDGADLSGEWFVERGTLRLARESS
jgi:hypothetical protein